MECKTEAEIVRLEEREREEERETDRQEERRCLREREK